MMNKTEIYDAAFSRWGFDAQMLVLNEEASELAASTSRFLNHRTNIGKVVSEIADVEIMIEQFRHSGFSNEVDCEKEKKLTRLSQRLGRNIKPVFERVPLPSELMNEAMEYLAFATAHAEVGTAEGYRKSANYLRSSMGRMMYAAQLCIREAQAKEQAQREAVLRGGSNAK